MYADLELSWYLRHLSRATFNEKKNALKRAGGRRRRAMKQLRKRKDSGRELNMWPPRSNNRDGPSNEDSLVWLNFGFYAEAWDNFAGVKTSWWGNPGLIVVAIVTAS